MTMESRLITAGKRMLQGRCSEIQPGGTLGKAGIVIGGRYERSVNLSGRPFRVQRGKGPSQIKTVSNRKKINKYGVGFLYSTIAGAFMSTLAIEEENKNARVRHGTQ